MFQQSIINSRASFRANSENWRRWLDWRSVGGLVCLFHMNVMLAHICLPFFFEQIIINSWVPFRANSKKVLRWLLPLEFLIVYLPFCFIQSPIGSRPGRNVLLGRLVWLSPRCAWRGSCSVTSWVAPTGRWLEPRFWRATWQHGSSLPVAFAWFVLFTTTTWWSGLIWRNAKSARSKRNIVGPSLVTLTRTVQSFTFIAWFPEKIDKISSISDFIVLY